MGALGKLAGCSGSWAGTSRLTDPSMNVSDDSPSTAELTPLLDGSFVRLDYTWAYQGDGQEGSLLIGFETGPAVVTAHWVDTWHMGEAVMPPLLARIGAGESFYSPSMVRPFASSCTTSPPMAMRGWLSRPTTRE